jgi:hypothetical protein
MVTVGASRSYRSGSDLIDPSDAYNVQWAQHAHAFIIRQPDDDIMLDDRGILRVFNTIDIAVTATHSKRLERRISQAKTNLLKHAGQNK